MAAGVVFRSLGTRKQPLRINPHGYGESDPNWNNDFSPKSVSNAEQQHSQTKSRFTTSGRSKTWKSTQAATNPDGGRSWQQGNARPWSSVERVTWTSNTGIL